jgi:hypothetical protein
VLLLLPGKLNDLVWHSELTDFLSRGFSVLLVVNVSVMAVSYVVASVAKTRSMS